MSWAQLKSVVSLESLTQIPSKRIFTKSGSRKFTVHETKEQTPHNNCVNDPGFVSQSVCSNELIASSLGDINSHSNKQCDSAYP